MRAAGHCAATLCAGFESGMGRHPNSARWRSWTQRMARWSRCAQHGRRALHAPATALHRSAGFVACPEFAGYEAGPHNQFLSFDLA